MEETSEVPRNTLVLLKEKVGGDGGRVLWLFAFSFIFKESLIGFSVRELDKQLN